MSSTTVTLLVIFSCLAVWAAGGLGIILSHGLCPCGGPRFPLEQYASLGPVEPAGAPGVYSLAVLPTAISDGNPAAIYWSDVSFSVFDPHWVSVPIRSVCVEAPTGAAEGIWSGTDGSWGSSSPNASAACTATSIPSGPAAPGNNLLDAHATLLFYLGATAEYGTTFAVNATGNSPGQPYGGSLSESLYWLPP